MSASKNPETKKASKDKTDHVAIRKGMLIEKRLGAQPIEGYQPLFKELTKLVPIDRNRY